MKNILTIIFLFVFLCAVPLTLSWSQDNYYSKYEGNQDAGAYSEVIIGSEAYVEVPLSLKTQIEKSENSTLTKAKTTLDSPQPSQKIVYSSVKSVTNASVEKVDNTSYTYGWGWSLTQSEQTSTPSYRESKPSVAKSLTEIVYKELPDARNITFKSRAVSENPYPGNAIKGIAEGGAGTGYFRNNIEVRTDAQGNSSGSGEGTSGNILINGDVAAGISGTWESPKANANSQIHTSNIIKGD
ncbi:MAG: hypothetical protein PF572_06365 [Patescibacteria group bacterium]|jgi:hypothetical protein|nr:hypothetical protein [Patescibacteria group bacterium]